MKWAGLASQEAVRAYEWAGLRPRTINLAKWHYPSTDRIMDQVCSVSTTKRAPQYLAIVSERRVEEASLDVV